MKIAFFLFLATYIFLSLFYRRFKNPYKLIMVFGKKGSGKSSYLVKMAQKYQKKKFTVYTNMDDCTLKNVRLIDPSKLGEFVPCENSVLLLDESGILFDNRNFKSFSPATRDFFKLQRHYKVVCFLASQSFDIDKKLRDLTDSMLLIQNVSPFLSLIRPITKKITLTEANSQGESRITDNLKFRWLFSWRFLYLPKYAKWFSSYKAPVKPEIQYKLV